MSTIFNSTVFTVSLCFLFFLSSAFDLTFRQEALQDWIPVVPSGCSPRSLLQFPFNLLFIELFFMYSFTRSVASRKIKGRGACNWLSTQCPHFGATSTVCRQWSFPRNELPRISHTAWTRLGGKRGNGANSTRALLPKGCQTYESG